MDAWDAVVEATEHRMRPILLTAAAASLALIPIAREVFWGPMAYAMMGGIIVGTLLTLLFLPALYVAWFRIRSRSPRARRERVTAPPRAIASRRHQLQPHDPGARIRAMQPSRIGSADSLEKHDAEDRGADRADAGPDRISGPERKRPQREPERPEAGDHAGGP